MLFWNTTALFDTTTRRLQPGTLSSTPGYDLSSCPIRRDRSAADFPRPSNQISRPARGCRRALRASHFYPAYNRTFVSDSIAPSLRPRPVIRCGPPPVRADPPSARRRSAPHPAPTLRPRPVPRHAPPPFAPTRRRRAGGPRPSPPPPPFPTWAGMGRAGPWPV